MRNTDSSPNDGEAEMESRQLSGKHVGEVMGH